MLRPCGPFAPRPSNRLRRVRQKRKKVRLALVLAHGQDTVFWPISRAPQETVLAYPALARAQVAQLVEQRTENPRVGSSNLPLGTI